MIGDWLHAAESDPQLMAIRQQEELIVQITELISIAMEKRGVSKADIAQRLGKSRPFVTQVLSGEANLTLRTIADMFTAMGLEMCVGYRDIPEWDDPIATDDFVFSWNAIVQKWPEQPITWAVAPSTTWLAS